MTPKSEDRIYPISIEPGILELLGPSLYTNIYYVLAELIANAYDANAKNIYIIKRSNEIIVEDDGFGMSYDDGDTDHYLRVAEETRTSSGDVYVKGSSKTRRRLGRKGIGKLAALAVSKEVLVKTIKNEQRSGFILPRKVPSSKRLIPINQEDIKFDKISTHGTSIVMRDPEYDFPSDPQVIKANVVKIFPLISKDFQIHIETPSNDAVTIKSFDTEIVKQLGGLMTFGHKYKSLSKYFDPELPQKKYRVLKDLLKQADPISIPLSLKTINLETRDYDLKIEGWLGIYKTTKDRKKHKGDFPDNFISLLSNGKMGEYNILPIAGKNKLQEVYVVGQLHIDLFEETELPDMALSNRQGYKSDDPRYIKATEIIRDKLLPELIELRNKWVGFKNEQKDKEKLERQKRQEQKLRETVDNFSNLTATKIVREVLKNENLSKEEMTLRVVRKLDESRKILKLKNTVDSNKKKVLISHSGLDKPLADLIFQMLVFNNIPEDVILYTSGSRESRLPIDESLFDYLRSFFIDSISNEKILVLYVTSERMAKEWNPVAEVGAGWVAQSIHLIFNVKGHRPEAPLDVAKLWQSTYLDTSGDIRMDPLEFDKFVERMIFVSEKLGYRPQSESANKTKLNSLVST
ncbi:ATP-binding protein [Patescibacteria group bacterium]|nr:ATP-binding protein [Patescibacteria group bacterium]